jgi:Fe-S cluster assembly iron-binding protein IscA
MRGTGFRDGNVKVYPCDKIERKKRRCPQVISITPAAREQLSEMLHESPDSLIRIVFTPACGGAGLSISLTDIRFSSDTSINIDGIPLVHAKNIAHLVDDITIDLISTEDGPDFFIHNGPPSC